MAVIPLGEFGQARAVPQPQVSRVDLRGLGQEGAAIENLGQTAMAVGDRMAQGEQQRLATLVREREQVARAEATNVLAADQLRVQAAVDDVADQLRRGANYLDAGRLYDEAVQKIEVPAIQGLSESLQLTFKGGIANARESGRLKLAGAVQQARRDDGQRKFGELLSILEQKAGMRGADVAGVNAQARAAVPMFREFGLDGSTLEKSVQQFAEKNWENQALARLNDANDDPAALRALLSDLSGEDGVYTANLDPGKRNVLTARISSRIDTLEDRAERAADRVDVAAERVLRQIDEQVASLVPPSAEVWTGWADVMAKASPERQAEFRSRVDEAREVQSFLRQPLDAQTRGLQERQTKLYTEGGDMQAVANFNRLQAAVEANQKQLTETPLQFAQSRMAEPVAPIDLAALVDPNGAAGVGVALEQRAGVVDGLRRRYGNQVAQHLLLPQEAQMLGSVLKEATPKQKAEVFGALRSAAGSDETYASLMKQLAPEEPVLALAGMLNVRNPQAANLVVQGQMLLNPPPGSRVTTPAMPPQAEFDGQLRTLLGDAYRGRPDAYSMDAQAIRAAYAGAVATDGDLSGRLNHERLRHVVTAVVGGTTKFNGRGTVILPYGLREPEFRDRIEAAWMAAPAVLPEDAPRRLSSYGLQQAGQGMYFVTAGRTLVKGPDGEPIVLDVTRPPAPRPAGGATAGGGR